MIKFSELPLCEALQENLAKNGFLTPTPVQAQAIPPALEGRDLLATAQTGTGKTLAFLLPILERLRVTRTRAAQAVVLVPTRELALQVMETFTLMRPKTGVTGAVVVGGLSEIPQLKEIRRGANIIVATPGRLEDFLRRRLIRLDSVEILVLDEADRMLDMGFQPSLQAIMGQLPALRQTMFFSATIEGSVAHLVERHLKQPAVVKIGSTTKPVDSVKLQLFEVSHESKFDLLQDLITKEDGTFLVFSRTKHGTERLAYRLSKAGLNAGRIHGDRSQSQRSAALKGFQDGKYRVLVATDVAARGIHVENIGHVVNFDLPQIPEDFIHRVGRTGRAASGGTAWTFATPQERQEIRRIEQMLQIRLERRSTPPGLASLASRPERTERPRQESSVEPKGRPRFFESSPAKRRRNLAFSTK
jgi:ATP-dependent RNA helicase RhlE